MVLFTGIIEEVGTVRRVSPAQGVIEIQAQTVLAGTRIGDSIAVNGVWKGAFISSRLASFIRRRTVLNLSKQRV